MGRVTEIGERLWTGEITPQQHHPWAALQEIEEIGPGIAFVSSFGNVTAIDTAEGLALIDTGSFLFAGEVHEQIRRWSARPLHTAIYSHGHVDHVFGVRAFEEEAERHGWAPPRVVAHEALPARFDRYLLTAGLNGCINARQFRVARVSWPQSYRYPDQTYRSELRLTVGDVRLELHHARGETDDHTWTWLPDHRLLCTGDMFIWATPNAGNPQKVQRYPGDWARALHRMADLGAEVMCPGHGFPIHGAERIRLALIETAELLESLHDQTVEMMNAGMCLDDIVRDVRVPAHLLERPYLQPIYDEPEFIVRNVWRLYGGWYEGDPARLKPAPAAAVAGELCRLAGGPRRLADRAAELARGDELALACHLVELAARAAPDDPDIWAVRADVYRRRAGVERSLMARGIYLSAADEEPWGER